jgi:hypothetical protein
VNQFAQWIGAKSARLFVSAVVIAAPAQAAGAEVASLRAELAAGTLYRPAGLGSPHCLGWF